MTKADTKRRKLEQQALKRFKEVAKCYTDDVNFGHGDTNKIAKLGRSSFQFGDLRVNTPNRHIIVEVESAGGVTNLVKYWYCLEERHIAKPIHLLHIFAQASENDYIRHLHLWDSLAVKMSNDLGNMFTAKQYTYCSSVELEIVVGEFDGILKKEFGR
jgi:hypothetical protein